MEGNASGAEWRTPPLWNIGLTAGVSFGEAYLHDGRARTLHEAIMWHGGEAETSRQAYEGLSQSEQGCAYRLPEYPVINKIKGCQSTFSPYISGKCALTPFLLLMLLFASAGARGQECAGGELLTQEAYQYGRFETRMQSAQGDGIVSSFFLYNKDLACNWPAENNEIDIEMTGNLDASVQFTTHYPGPTSVTHIEPTLFNPHAGMHDYAFEWEPGVVRWFIDGSLVYTQDAPYVDGLVYPMRIMMNLHVPDAPGWVGIWDPAVMPVESTYDYVRYYAYTPGSGDAGTGNNFTLDWTDEFDTPLDTTRWEVSEFWRIGGNYCTFVSNNVSTVGGKLQLEITEPLATTYSPVHFSVDAGSLNLSPSDVVYLNGGFNNWCGSCNPMSDSDGDNIWELTLSLPAGNHEYLFTTNGWNGEVGGAPLGSSCDFSPCDQYANYGVSVPYGAGAIATDTYCWSSCASCTSDADGDGVIDAVDNCTAVANAGQQDTDDDGHGNICDGDFNNTCGVVDFTDLAAFKALFFTTNPLFDLDSSGGPVDFIDLSFFKNLFFSPPGPSATGLCPN